MCLYFQGGCILVAHALEVIILDKQLSVAHTSKLLSYLWDPFHSWEARCHLRPNTRQGKHSPFSLCQAAGNSTSSLGYCVRHLILGPFFFFHVGFCPIASGFCLKMVFFFFFSRLFLFLRLSFCHVFPYYKASTSVVSWFLISCLCWEMMFSESLDSTSP